MTLPLRGRRVVAFPWAALALGGLAGLLLLACWYALAQLIDAPFFPDVFATTLVRDTPGDTSTWILETLGHNAARLARAVGLLLLPLLVAAAAALRPAGWDTRAGVVLGVLLSAVALLLAYRTPDTRVTPGAALFIAMAACVVCVLLGQRLAALRRIDDEIAVQAAMATTWLDAPGGMYRRAFLLRTLALAGGLTLAGAGAGWFGGRWRAVPDTLAGLPLPQVRALIAAGVGTPPPTVSTPVPAPTVALALPETGFVAPETVRERLTPNDEFYVVDIALRDPVIPETDWTLRVRGLVDRELVLTYADLLERPARDLPGTLRCISYTYGNDLMSTTIWTGTSLGDLLREAGVQDAAADVILRGGGGYSDSVPLEAALGPDALLAYAMQGETLAIAHGFPCRLFIPNLYGEKNVKWLHTIEVVSYDYRGFWQERGWTETAIINVLSAVDVPAETQVLVTADGATIGGVAFAGQRGIATVDVQVGDGGWQAAEVEPYVPDLVWQRWRLHLPADAVRDRDEIEVSVRAVDTEGEGQDPDPRDPHPDGLTGLHRITVPLRRV